MNFTIDSRFSPISTKNMQKLLETKQIVGDDFEIYKKVYSL